MRSSAYPQTVEKLEFVMQLDGIAKHSTHGTFVSTQPDKRGEHNRLQLHRTEREALANCQRVKVTVEPMWG